MGWLWDTSGVYSFDNGRTVTVHGLPPAPVVWVYNTADLVCHYAFFCDNWRSYLQIPQDSWFSEQYRVPRLPQYFQDCCPDLLSFSDFRKQQQPPEQSSTWHAVYRYAFHTSDTSLGDLTTPTALLVLLGLVLAFRHVKGILCPCFSATGRRVARLTHGQDWIDAKHNQVRITKFGEYVFRLLYHLAISIYGIWYFHDKEWWQKGNTVAVFSGFPYHAIEPGMAWYYLLQSAYNLDAFWSLLELSFVIKLRSVRKKGGLQLIGWQSPIAIEWSPSVRGDFQEMMVHHVATNLLVLGSSLFRFTRIGSMVFLVHDISDVPVDLSKLFNFLKWKWSTLFSFTVLTVLWLYTRLYIFPFTIYRSLLTECHYVMQEGFPVLIYIAYRHFFYFFLGLLILLHAAWFVMFLRMYHTFFVKKEGCHDLSEHKGGEPTVMKHQTTDEKKNI